MSSPYSSLTPYLGSGRALVAEIARDILFIVGREDRVARCTHNCVRQSIARSTIVHKHESDREPLVAPLADLFPPSTRQFSDVCRPSSPHAAHTKQQARCISCLAKSCLRVLNLAPRRLVVAPASNCAPEGLNNQSELDSGPDSAYVNPLAPAAQALLPLCPARAAAALSCTLTVH